uniref:Helicase-associated domain-containing protein n=1 Tax=Craspedostauros australis TaxID=1486917 RepID=A0A7S0F6N8_9STRA
MSASASVCASMPPSLSLPLSLTNEFIPQQQHQQQQQQQQQKLSRRTNYNRSYRHSQSQNHGSAQQEQRFGASNTQKWMGKYKELLHFVQQHGHSLVPLDYKANPSLAHWVKRQRCQYKAKVAGTHSTLTAERQQMLEDLTFCWDSHRAAWEERFRQLNGFKCQYGHCNVPSKYGENQSLAIWVKCQRRQYKLHRAGKKSNLNDERISKLSQMGFVWTPREVRSSHSPAAPSVV